jgi:hypothetical protein
MSKKEIAKRRFVARVQTNKFQVPAVAYIVDPPDPKPRTIKAKVTSEVKKITRPKFHFDA